MTELCVVLLLDVCITADSVFQLKRGGSAGLQVDEECMQCALMPLG
jgi:hypothetical protein